MSTMSAIDPTLPSFRDAIENQWMGVVTLNGQATSACNCQSCIDSRMELIRNGAIGRYSSEPQSSYFENPEMPESNNATHRVPDSHPALIAIIGAPATAPSAANIITAPQTGRRRCSACGILGHNTRTCPTLCGAAIQAPGNPLEPSPLWDMVGIEIEGRFLNLDEKRTLAVRITGERGTSDGSVHGSNNRNLSPWEFRTRPGKVAPAISQLHQLYPDETGQDCGMHVHVSFATADISLLASTQFFAYFKQRWTEWGERNSVHRASQFWTRLRGENTYCRANVAVPYNLTNMDRYHQLNFSSWESHKTVECRLLPMFKSEAVAISAVQELINIYETWLGSEGTINTLLPESVVELPTPEADTMHINSEVDFVPIAFSQSHEIAMNIIPPAPEGMRRVVIPQGQVMRDGISDLADQHRAVGVRNFIRDNAVRIAA